MDAQRFDNLAKSLANRFTRRKALRQAGAAASATLLAAAGARSLPAAAAQADGQPVYTVIRRYTLSGPTSDVRAALERGYIEDACDAPGFIAYFAVEDEDGDFATVAVFRSQQDFENFASAEAAWIAQNLGDLLPAPDVAISGDTYVHVGAPQQFRNTCPGSPPVPTAAPTAPPAPTAAPVGPTPTPEPPCTGRGCVCMTGTQNPCDAPLVCCPTTDVLGGPGVCRREAACYPNQCTSNGDACDESCNFDDACPSCCSGHCGGVGQCADAPVVCDPNVANACGQGMVCCAVQNGYICVGATECGPCTSQGCDCTGGVQGNCDAGLVCCQGGQPVPGGAGTCQPQAQCPAPCTGQGCACNGGVQGNCDAGLVCCQGGQPIPGGAGTCEPQAQCCTAAGCNCFSGTQDRCDAGLICCPQSMGGGDMDGRPGICMTEAQCNPPCTSQDCACNGGVQGACDTGLVCCQDGQPIPGGAGTCQPEAQCPAPCTGQGCDCTGGVQGNCDAGLVCCQGGAPIPGGAGTCEPEAQCPPPPCTGEGCDCNGGVQGACDAGLICCQFDASVPGGAGTCQPEAACGPPPCTDFGVACAASCAWDAACGSCCSGYCNVNGICDNWPAPPCTGEGCECITGTLSPCDGDLLCCQTSDVPGGPGVCQASC